LSRGKRFWTDRDWPQSERIRTGMAAQLARFAQRPTVVADTPERLDVRPRRLSTAVL